MSATISLGELNRSSDKEFTRLLGDIYEHSAWVAANAYRRAPFADVSGLRVALRDAVTQAPRSMQLGLLLAHPELAGKEASSNTLTAHSSAEQKGAGLINLSAAEKTELAELNHAYREKFGFPFIIAVRHHSKAGIFDQLRSRAAGNDIEREFATCLDQVHEIASLRLQGLMGSQQPVGLR